ncbi:MAG: hypothetical protein CM15mP102_21480 [Flavobacteriales bacterium]|nr:MAG: hypothetical protein CM15mP102_21480 [Flavobacteriales bacterium]
MLPFGDSKSNSGKVLEKLSKLSKPSFGILSIIYAASLRSYLEKLMLINMYHFDQEY